MIVWPATESSVAVTVFEPDHAELPQEPGRVDATDSSKVPCRDLMSPAART